MATSTINYKWAADLTVGDVIRVKNNNHKITALSFTPTKRHIKLILDGNINSVCTAVTVRLFKSKANAKYQKPVNAIRSTSHVPRTHQL